MDARPNRRNKAELSSFSRVVWTPPYRLMNIKVIGFTVEQFLFHIQISRARYEMNES